jgi:hypothetical protein
MKRISFGSELCAGVKRSAGEHRPRLEIKFKNRKRKTGVCAPATRYSACQQPLRVACRDTEVRPTKVLQHGIVDANDFALRVEQRSPRSS